LFVYFAFFLTYLHPLLVTNLLFPKQTHSVSRPDVVEGDQTWLNFFSVLW